MIKRIRFWLTLVLVTLCCVALTACGLPGAPSQEKPQRIVTLNLDADELILDLVPAKRITAVTELVDNPGVSYSVNKAKQVQKRVKAYTLEEILSLQPDLVIVSEWLDASLRKSLEDMGIRVYTYKTPTTLAEIAPMVNGIAKAVGEPEKGAALVKQFETQRDKVLQAAAKVPANEQVKIFLWAYHGPYGAGDTLFGDMCRKMNIHNSLDNYGAKEISALREEFVIQVNPDVILLTNWDFEGSPLAKMRARFADDPAYASIKAVQNDRFVSIPGRALFCPNHYAAQGMKEIFTAVYPDYAKGIE